MKNYLLIIAISLPFVMCAGGRRTAAGNAGPLTGSQIYLYEIQKGPMKAADSAVIKNGRFEFDITQRPGGLVFVGTEPKPEKGGYVFLDGSRVRMTASLNRQGNIVWEVDGSPCDKAYRDFENLYPIAIQRQRQDSLDGLFRQAREAGNREEMARLKEESTQNYERGNVEGMKLIKKTIDENHDNPFGFYLYYTYIFPRKTFSTTEETDAEREYLNGFGESVRASSGYRQLTEKLDKYAKCAIGSPAPEIEGVDTLGNTLKLSDMRGNYVIVDFWDSYCHWCRMETPYLLKAQEKFKGKNFRILGVSLDRTKDRWIEAIHEDGSYWDHLLLPENSKVRDAYCIKAIPHLILIGPDGVILAKNLRQDDHIEVTERFIDGL